MAFNDIRTTLQALIAIYDNCNSLHTNAYDEAVTTPTEESVRRALAIQLIINREWGLAMNENPLQGSFIIEELTDLVEEAVLDEFERHQRARRRARAPWRPATSAAASRTSRCSTSSASTTAACRSSASTPSVNPRARRAVADVELARSTDDEKQEQLPRLRDFQARHAGERPAALERLPDAAIAGDNIFAVLMDAVRCCSLGEITATLFEVGGQYRRNV